jgi:formate/nitrite transporter FocA (FNT family)
MAVITGVLIDLLGTIIIAVLLGFALGFYLLSQGVAESELEAVLTAKIMHAPWNIFLIALGASISVLAGYVTAKIAKHGVYIYAGIVGCISGGFGYSTGLDEYSVPLNLSLALLTIVATVFGAFLWLRKNPPSMTTIPVQ